MSTEAVATSPVGQSEISGSSTCGRQLNRNCRLVSGKPLSLSEQFLNPWPRETLGLVATLGLVTTSPAAAYLAVAATELVLLYPES